MGRGTFIWIRLKDPSCLTSLNVSRDGAFTASLIFKYHGEWFINWMMNLRTQRCMSSGPVDLSVFTTVFLWSQSGFSFTVGGTFLLQSPSGCPPTGEMWGEKMPVKTGGVKKYLEYVSFILTHCYWIVSFAYHGGIPSLTCLFWLTYLILHIPCPVKLQQHFDPPDHIPTKPGSIPLLFPGYLSLLLLPVHLLLVHLFDQQVSTMLVSFLLFLRN